MSRVVGRSSPPRSSRSCSRPRSFALRRRATPAPRWIVFSAHPNGDTGPIQLIRVQTNGAGLKQITTGRLSATEPAFSPDGKRIAFARLGSGVFTMNLDGTGMRRLTSGSRDIYPVWSPDGKRIAFLRPFRAEWRLYVMSSTGAGRAAAAASAARGSADVDSGRQVHPHPRGRGSRAGGLPDREDPEVLRPDAGHQTTQTATVSPDARRSRTSGRAPAPAPRTAARGGARSTGSTWQRVPAPHRPRRIVNDTGAAGWSPDGKTLVFVHRDALTLRIVASGATRTIDTGTHVAVGDSPPAWQPR